MDEVFIMGRLMLSFKCLSGKDLYMSSFDLGSKVHIYTCGVMRRKIKDEKIFAEDARRLSLKEMSKKYKVKQCTVSKWKNKLGIVTVRKNIDIPGSFLRDVNKYTRVELAKKYGVSKSLISKWRKKIGRANVWKKELINWDEFDDVAKILSNDELMRKYGVSRSTIKRWKKDRGLTNGKKENKPIRFIKIEKTGCWICTSHKLDDKGYPQCKGDKLVVKRLWKEKYGEWPKGAICCHKCDNTACVNPDHVYPGTRSSNQRDMAIRGRSPWGDRNGMRKLNSKQAVEIYNLKGQMTQKEVAKKFGVSKSNIQAIWSGKTWVRDIAGEKNFPVKLTKVKGGLSGFVERGAR